MYARSTTARERDARGRRGTCRARTPLAGARRRPPRCARASAPRSARGARASVAHAAAHRRAVEIGAARRRRRRGVRHLVGRASASRGCWSAGRPELAHRDAEHLRVQALPHLGAAVVHLHRAVAVDEHERAGLVVAGRGERDAELHRRDREAALDVRAASRSTPRSRAGARRSATRRAAACQIAWMRLSPISCRSASCSSRRVAVIEIALAHDLGRRARAGARCGRGSPRSRACPAGRRSRGTPCARRRSSSRRGR